MSKSPKKMATVKNNDSKNNKSTWLPKTFITVTLVLILSGGIVIYNNEFILQKWQQWTQDADLNDRDLVSSKNRQRVTPSTSKHAEWDVQLAHSVEFIDLQDINIFAKKSLEQSFFALDIENAINVLSEYPWIKEVSARKVWPNTLLIEVKERQPWLRLNDDALIGRDGSVFYPNNIALFEELPLLSGQYGKTEDLLAMYAFFTQQVATEGNAIRSLKYDPIVGWKLTLNNNIQLLVGKKHLAERLDRVTEIFMSLSKDEYAVIEYLDVRYQNGIAVGWQNSEQAEQIARL